MNLQAIRGGFPSRDPYQILENYISNFRKANRIIIDVNYSLDRTKYLKRDFPKGTILIAISFIFLTFIFGVLFPIVKPDTNRFFLIWEPVVFYVIAFGELFLKIWRT
jgi:hypothetical protein